MTHWKAAALASVAALMTAPALAADFPQIIDVPQIVEPPAPVVVGGGWYLRGDVGVSVRNEADFHNRTLAGDNPHYGVQEKGTFLDAGLSEGASIGVGAGYRFNKFFRADVTAEFRGSIEVDATSRHLPFGHGHHVAFHEGRLNSKVFLANAYADFGTFGRLTPFIGVGLGTAHHTTTDERMLVLQHPTESFYAKEDPSNWSLAYAVHAGLGFKASKNLTLEAGYRYLNLGDVEPGVLVPTCPTDCKFDGNELKKLDSHEIRLGMRWEFGGEDHYVEPMPPVHYPPVDIPYKH